jgi:hypothetical protein
MTMGDAKRRGTFEERKQAAIARDRILAEQMQLRRTFLRDNRKDVMAYQHLLALAAGINPNIFRGMKGGL